MSNLDLPQTFGSTMKPAPLRIAPRRTIVNFPGQYYDEEVILLCRRTFIPFISILLVMILLLPCPFLIWLLTDLYFGVKLLATDANIILFIMISTLYYLVLNFFVFTNWLDFYFDVTIVTDRRIVDIDQLGLINRTISETNLVDIKESFVEQNGIFQNLFNYGTVSIQVPATRQSIEIDAVFNPREVARVINDLHNQIVQKQRVRVVSANEAEKSDEQSPNGYLQHQP